MKNDSTTGLVLIALLLWAAWRKESTSVTLTTTCPDGTVVPLGQQCPDGSVGLTSGGSFGQWCQTCGGNLYWCDGCEVCPTCNGYQICPDGSVVPSGQDCPNPDGF